MIYAAGAGSTNTLRLLLTRGAVVDATNRAGLTALGNAAGNNRTFAALMLIEAGADPNHADASGVTPLHAASMFGSVEVGRALLAKGARTEVFAQAARLTPLSQAAMVGHADFVDLLLAHRASVATRDASGHTPLHLAATGQRVTDLPRTWKSELQKLANRGPGSEAMAEAMRQMSNRVAALETSLPEGSLRGGGEHRRVAEALLAQGAALEATNRDACTPLLTAALFTNLPVAEVLVAHKANLNARAKDGSPPLNLAALKGSVPITDLLLKAGANSDLQDNEGFTPLNTALEQAHPDVARVLLTHGANPNLARRSGQTPMHTAAGHGDLESLRLLLDHGAALHPLETAGTPLSVAVQYRQVETVKFLLQHNAKPDVAPPQNGMTSLHWAATLGHPEIVKLLLDARALVDANSSWQGTPLQAVAAGREGAQKWLASAYAQFPSGANILPTVLGSEADYLAVMRLLLAAKANVNAHDPRYERTPIFEAIKQGQFAAVEILLAADADLKTSDRQGMTPLHAASEMEAPAEVVSNIVTRLLQAGADKEARDQFFATPLHAAANAGNLVMVQLLLEAGARINAAGPNLSTPLQFAVMRGRRDVVEVMLARRPGPDLEWRNKFGTTALQQAAQLQSQDIVALLLDHGAVVDTVTAEGATALMVSASNGDVDTLRLLLKRDANVNASNINGFTAFLIAAQAGKVEAARLLLDQGATFDVSENTGYTPLMLAVRNGHLEMAKFLLDRSPRIIDAKNNVGFTALHEAADQGHPELVEFLLNRGMKADVRCDLGGTPLHNTAHGHFNTNQTRYVEVIKVLLAHEADVNALRRDHQTPLHRAAERGRPQIMQALLDARANPSVRDENGKTALDLAIAGNHSECAALLRSAIQKETGDALVPKPLQNTNPLPSERKP